MSVETTCGACGKSLESFDTIHVGQEGPRCYGCFNRETAERLGIVFDNRALQPIVVDDADGVPHTFTIRSMLVPTGHAMEALEIVGDGRQGYRFSVLGTHEADARELFALLDAKMRREMAIRHVQRTAAGWQLTSDERFVGRIEWDSDTDGVLPLIVIDGKRFTWEQVGRMLTTFEGFTLDARIKDTIEVVTDSA